VQLTVVAWIARLELTRFSGHLECESRSVEMTMSKPSYAAEYRQQMVELVRRGSPLVKGENWSKRKVVYDISRDFCIRPS